MRIRQLTAYRVRIDLKKEIRHASHSRSDTESIIVRCELDSGQTGWGEGLPRSYVTGETIDSACQQFQSTDWNQLAAPIDSIGDSGAVARALAAHFDALGRDLDIDCRPVASGTLTRVVGMTLVIMIVDPHREPISEPLDERKGHFFVAGAPGVR